MTHSIRIGAFALVAFGLALAGARGVHTQEPVRQWQVGDVFAGIGHPAGLPGRYVVLDGAGVPTGDVLIAPALDPDWESTTGCAIDFDLDEDGIPREALFGTTLWGRSITRTDAAAPHASSRILTLEENAASLPDSVSELVAVESIAFDNNIDGYFYVGGQRWEFDSSQTSSEDASLRRGYIFKFEKKHPYTLVATFEVPADESGVDWVDIGADQETIYYTSQAGIPVAQGGQGPSAIHEFNTATRAYRRIEVRDGTTPMVNRLHALRALPPHPGQSVPSGFLVTTGDLGVLRVTYEGQVLRRYEAPGVTGSYFALNITPDGQSFWTASYQISPYWRFTCPVEGGGTGEWYTGDKHSCPTYNPATDAFDRPQPTPEGKLMRFHIATGTMTAGPISLVAEGQAVENIWGLCVRREYTASSNTCFEMDDDGRPVLDAEGLPKTMDGGCRVPPVTCTTSSTDPDCRVPGTPSIVVTDKVNWVGETVAGESIIAQHPSDEPMVFEVTGLPAGLTFLQTSGSGGVISGTLAWTSGRADAYNVRVRLSWAGEPARTKSVSTGWFGHEMRPPPSRLRHP